MLVHRRDEHKHQRYKGVDIDNLIKIEQDERLSSISQILKSEPGAKEYQCLFEDGSCDWITIINDNIQRLHSTVPPLKSILHPSPWQKLSGWTPCGKRLIINLIYVRNALSANLFNTLFEFFNRIPPLHPRDSTWLFFKILVTPSHPSSASRDLWTVPYR